MRVNASGGIEGWVRRRRHLLASTPVGGLVRHIVVTQNITLDGVVDNTRSWFDPTADTQQGRELAATTAEHAAASDGFLVGRTTIKEMRGFWTQKVDDKIRSH